MAFRLEMKHKLSWFSGLCTWIGVIHQFFWVSCLLTHPAALGTSQPLSLCEPIPYDKSFLFIYIILVLFFWRTLTNTLGRMFLLVGHNLWAEDTLVQIRTRAPCCQRWGEAEHGLDVESHSPPWLGSIRQSSASGSVSSGPPIAWAQGSANKSSWAKSRLPPNSVSLLEHNHAHLWMFLHYNSQVE